MFERYTEKARRVIFFARYEASHFGSPYIESEHMLLGLLREDKALTNRFLTNDASVESIRRQVEGHIVIREKLSTSVDIPLSNECKRILAYAAEEAERLAHPHIGTEHLLLGILREEECFAAELLDERGVRLETVRAEIAAHPAGSQPAGESPTRHKIPALTIHFLDVAGTEVQPPVYAMLPFVVPRIGESIAVTTPFDPERLYRVQDVRWCYIAGPNAQEVTLTLEPFTPKKPAAS